MSEERSLNQRPADHREWPGVLLGIMILAGLHALLLLPLYLDSNADILTVASYYSLNFIGLSQLIYVIPAILIAWRKGRHDILKGLIIGAAITFLLNAACWGLISTASQSNALSRPLYVNSNLDLTVKRRYVKRT